MLFYVHLLLVFSEASTFLGQKWDAGIALTLFLWIGNPWLSSLCWVFLTSVKNKKNVSGRTFYSGKQEETGPHAGDCFLRFWFCLFWSFWVQFVLLKPKHYLKHYLYIIYSFTYFAPDLSDFYSVEHKVVLKNCTVEVNWLSCHVPQNKVSHSGWVNVDTLFYFWVNQLYL